jgi:hypothetical protein
LIEDKNDFSQSRQRIKNQLQIKYIAFLGRGIAAGRECLQAKGF